jgi:hypothetical protein
MKQYMGVLFGGLYGLTFRLLGEAEFESGFFSLYSITFVWVVPIVMGIIPLIFAPKEIGASRSKQFFFPILSVLLFFMLAFTTRLEDIICLLIIGFPFIVGAGLAGLAVGFWIQKINEKKMYMLLFLPLLLNPLESLLPTPQTDYEVKNQILIEKGAAEIWQHLIEVPEIAESEFDFGPLNYMGVPRPIKSQLEVIDGKTYRIGYFSDGLKLVESIAMKDSLKALHFDIHIDKSTLRDLPMDKHILESGYFQFNDIAYHLREISPTQTEVTLSCDYTIRTRFNFYSNFWASWVIGDFEQRLLEVLKGKLGRVQAL